jgi:hypothetical protein
MKAIMIVVAAALLVLTITAAQKNGGKTPAAPVSFSKDVKPILAKKCLDCHSTDDENSNKFYVDNYDVLMKESKHGVNIIPGKGEESTIIKKLRGTASFGARMPKRGKLVPDSLITVISRWIDEGAKNN